MKRATILMHILSLIGHRSRMDLTGREASQDVNILLSSKVSRSYLEKVQIPQILKEVTSGPLKGQKVTLIVANDQADSSIIENDLLKILDTPTGLLRIPREDPLENYLNNSNVYSLGNTNDAGGPFEFPLMSKVVVMIVTSDDELWWPFWFPPKDWSISAIVLISSSPSCWQKSYLQGPLLHKTASLALICPHLTSRASGGRYYFKVRTWLPFASGRKVVDLGYWDSGYFSSWDRLFIDRFRDMSTKQMSILGNSEDRPLLYTRADGAPKGLNYLVLDSLSKWLGFHYEFTLGSNVKWPTITELVQKGEKDMMINYATLTPERNRLFDISVPYYYEGFGLMLKVPPPLPRWQNIVYPFSWYVWYATLGSLVITAFFFHLLYYEKQKSIIINTITITQSLLSSPLATVPASWRIRFFLLVWWIASWLLNMSYTCNLIAVLTIPVFPTRIQTAKELAESDYRLCMLDYGEFVPEALRSSTHPTLSALGAKLDMVPLMEGWDDIGEEACVERVVDGSHGHTETYSYVNILYNKLGHNSRVYSLKEQLYPGYLSFMVHKNAPWKYKFDLGMQRLLETGLMKKWYEEAMAEFKGKPTEESSSGLQPLSLAHLQGPFLVMAGGFFGALLVFAGEVVLPSSVDDVHHINSASY